MNSAVKTMAKRTMRLPAAILASAVATAGCMSMSGQGTLDAVQDALSGKGETQVYTEAYIEFAGPGGRWAGPQSLLLHVSAKDPEQPAEISVTPVMFQSVEAAPEVASEGRKPASQTDGGDAPAEEGPPVSKVTAAQAREQLAFLGLAVQNDSQPYSGCLYPVRVRLVKVDGALVDQQGCRGSTPWTRVASQTVDYFMRNR